MLKVINILEITQTIIKKNTDMTNIVIYNKSKRDVPKIKGDYLQTNTSLNKRADEVGKLWI